MKYLKFALAISLIVPSLMFADQERVAVGSRPISEEAEKEIKSRKGNVEAEAEDQERASQGSIYDQYPPIFYSTSHHWLNAITVMDNNQYTLELEDGSIWKINSYDGVKALNWLANDPLTITQNSRWFSKHDYLILNKANGTSVEATLFLGPVILGDYSLFIIGIDYDKGQILLNDQTAWDISYLDHSIFKDWALDDYIIIGSNSDTSIWDSSSDVLLINANLNTATRAKQF